MPRGETDSPWLGRREGCDGPQVLGVGLIAQPLKLNWGQYSLVVKSEGSEARGCGSPSCSATSAVGSQASYLTSLNLGLTV